MTIGHQTVNWICGVTASVAFASAMVTAQSPGSKATGPLGGLEANTGAAGKACRATGDPCFAGIDPDVYQMPLFGEYIQSGDRLICATRNWSSYPPEAFSIDFMRAFWPLMTPQDQATTEGAALFFATTHWGPPAAPPTDLGDVAVPADFADEVFSSLQGRTSRIQFEVPKTDFEILGWFPAYLPAVLPPDVAPKVPHKLRGWYIRGDGLVRNGGDRDDDGREDRSREHPLVILSSGFPYSIAFNQSVGGIAVGKQLRKTATYLVAQGYIACTRRRWRIEKRRW